MGRPRTSGKKTTTFWAPLFLFYIMYRFQHSRSMKKGSFYQDRLEISKRGNSKKWLFSYSTEQRRAAQFHYARPDAEGCANARRVQLFDGNVRGVRC